MTAGKNLAPPGKFATATWVWHLIAAATLVATTVISGTEALPRPHHVCTLQFCHRQPTSSQYGNFTSIHTMLDAPRGTQTVLRAQQPARSMWILFV